MRLRYRLLQCWARLAARIVYRRVDVTGAEHVAGDRPVVLAPNHSNGLADIAVIVAKMRRFPRFGAASSWWTSTPARLLFDFGGVLPIYRGRDGSTKKNVGTFAALHEALAQHSVVVIFPEGEMNLEPALLPLKTGVARVAFGAAIEAGVADVAIVPCGLVYEERRRFRSDAEIRFGEPISIADWMERYRGARHTAVRGVMQELTDRLNADAVAQPTRLESVVVDRAARIVRGTASYAERNTLRRALAAAIAESGGAESAEFTKLAAAVEAYDAIAMVAPVDARVRRELMLLAPVAAAGLVMNAPVVLGAWAANTRSPNEGWDATAKGVAGTVLVPLVWGAEYGVVTHIWGRRRALGALAATVVGGSAALAWLDRWQRRRERVPGRNAPADPAEVTALVLSLTGVDSA
jgi:1-acyl-sn-glycerol-3-phosphate acyltransferase